jgi:formylglycine-generating enzyme required for sulfatase activity
MYGNVAEWCIDGYEADHYANYADKEVSWREVFSKPKDLFPRVCRGGHWDAEAAQCRSAFRLFSDPMWQDRDPQIPKSIWWYTDAFHVGFRVVRPLNVPESSEQLIFWDADTPGHKEVLEDGSKQVRAKVGTEE